MFCKIDCKIADLVFFSRDTRAATRSGSSFFLAWVGTPVLVLIVLPCGKSCSGGFGQKKDDLRQITWRCVPPFVTHSESLNLFPCMHLIFKLDSGNRRRSGNRYCLLLERQIIIMTGPFYFLKTVLSGYKV